KAAYWWTLLGVLVILSYGAYVVVDGHPYRLPALWLKENVPGFGPIRVFARFNQVVAVVASVIAAAALAAIRNRLPGRLATAVTAVLFAVALVDLVPTNFPHSPLPEMPASYRVLADRDPDAAIV